MNNKLTTLIIIAFSMLTFVLAGKKYFDRNK
jgi:hypothetical protein